MVNTCGQQLGCIIATTGEKHYLTWIEQKVKSNLFVALHFVPSQRCSIHAINQFAQLQTILQILPLLYTLTTCRPAQRIAFFRLLPLLYTATFTVLLCDICGERETAVISRLLFRCRYLFQPAVQRGTPRKQNKGKKERSYALARP